MLFGTIFWFLVIIQYASKQFFGLMVHNSGATQSLPSCAYGHGNTYSETASLSLSAFNIHSLSTMTLQALRLLVLPAVGEGTAW